MYVSPRYLIIPLLAIFSVSSMGVVLIYYLNKKDDDDDLDDLEIKHLPQSTKEIKVPYQLIPALIGRKGTTIANIQSTTSTIINFKEEKDVDSPDRICIISGSKTNIQLAEERINDFIKNQPIIEQDEIWVPQRTINSMSDRGNEVLNQIQNSSNAKVIFDQFFRSNDLDNKKRVILMGTKEQIAKAVELIENKVEEDKQIQIQTEIASLTRVSRVKNSPEKLSSKKHLIDIENSRDIFTQENEGLMEVFVCAVDNPSQFYIQVIGPGNALLDDLIKEMTEYYESEQNRELHILKNITVGQMVAAKFSIDNKWYRAEVIEDVANQNYNVYFVDFGDREKISQENIFEIRTDFLSLRFQAVECHLADVKPLDDRWSMEAAVIFANLCGLGNWQVRVAKIKGYKERGTGFRPSKREGSPIPYIELYEKLNDQLISIGKELVKRGLACDSGESWSAVNTTSPTKQTPTKPSPTKPSPAKPSSAKPSPAKPSPAKPSPAKVSPTKPSPIKPSPSRVTKSPEEAVVEEVDLTFTPKTKKNVEVIDLTTTPSKEWDNDTSTPRYFDEKKISPIMWNANNNTKPHNTTVKNPFKENNNKTETLPRNIIPAGYESELSSDSDGFDLYP